MPNESKVINKLTLHDSMCLAMLIIDVTVCLRFPTIA